MEFTITKVESLEDHNKLVPLYHEFFQSMPLTTMFGLEGNETRAEPKYGPEDFLVKAVDPEGNIIGFASNKVNARITREPGASPERVELEEFTEFIRKNAQLDRLPQRWIELRVLSVSKNWRQRGVARRLAEESMKIARNSGFKALMMCCVSEYTARLARSLGWTEFYRLAHKDYPQLSGRNVNLKEIPPHDHVYYFYVEL